MDTEKCKCTCHLLMKFGWKKENIKAHICCPRVVEIIEPVEKTEIPQKP